MTFYTYNANTGFDPVFLDRHETLQDAGAAILAYDQQRSGVTETDNDGFQQFVPWQLPHRGPRRMLWSFGADSEAEAYERVAQNAYLFGFDVLNDEQLAELTAEMEEV